MCLYGSNNIDHIQHASSSLHIVTFVTQRRNFGHSVMSASRNYKYLARRNLNQTTFPSSSHLLVVGSRVTGIGAPSEGDDQRFPMRLRKPSWTRLGQRVAYPVLNLSSS
ncbi:hypothetical protein HGRIS_006185 [Hohenbuehelia grisea]|uniref:Uncharacterized protein n=1 Tax=Hohenbuehelia grisea TaxID=104357 RepID=A0ABR3JZ30_9AGAR